MRALLLIVVLAAAGFAGWQLYAADAGFAVEDATSWVRNTADTGKPGVEVRYQYVDSSGQVQLVGSLDEVPAEWRDRAGRIEVQVPIRGASPAPGHSPAAASAAVAASPDVVFITQRNCGWCDKTKQWLDRQGVFYDEVDVDLDPAGARAFGERHGQLVAPSVEIDGQPVFGYDPDKMGELLGI